MPLTLWRGDRPLGEIHPHAAVAGEGIAGILLPAADAPPLAGVWQVRLPPDFGDAVYQEPLAPDVAADRAGRPPHQRSAEVALVPVPPGEALGVPPAAELTVRDEAGRVLPTSQLILQEHVPDPAGPDAERSRYPAAARVGGSVWTVNAPPAPPVAPGPHAPTPRAPAR